MTLSSRPGVVFDMSSEPLHQLTLKESPDGSFWGRDE